MYGKDCLKVFKGYGMKRSEVLDERTENETLRGMEVSCWSVLGSIGSAHG